VDPPTPPEFAFQLIADTANSVRFPVERLAAQIADELRDGDHSHPLMHGEELAGRAVDELWHEEGLGSAYERALAEVHEEYVARAARVLDVADDLVTAGRESWIARALRHQFAFDASWEAQDRLGLLTRFDDGALCATCGATLGTCATGEEVSE
jgi:hypothetical protein